jgi:tetrapyrrole methylase family protein / MazG family protein
MASYKKEPRKSKRRAPQTGKVRQLGRMSAGPWFEKLVALQARLRAVNGCPWDREQTHASLRTYLVEETYEVLDALESGDDAKLSEEMGDLLLQIVFHSQIACETRRFTITDVIRDVHEKMVRRHPHVFGQKRAKNAAEVLKNWEQVKTEERRAKGVGHDANAKQQAHTESLMDGVAGGLPATLEGLQLTRRAARIGFDWDNVEGIFEKIREEGAELRHALGTKDQAKVEEEIGDLLFAAINLARYVHVDPEIALKKANAKFARRFRAMEQLARDSGSILEDVSRAEMEALWETAKRNEKLTSAGVADEAPQRK